MNDEVKLKEGVEPSEWKMMKTISSPPGVDVRVHDDDIEIHVPRCDACDHVYDARLEDCPVCEVTRLNGELTRLQKESRVLQRRLDTVHINLRKIVNWLQG